MRPPPGRRYNADGSVARPDPTRVIDNCGRDVTSFVNAEDERRARADEMQARLQVVIDELAPEINDMLAEGLPDMGPFMVAYGETRRKLRIGSAINGGDGSNYVHNDAFESSPSGWQGIARDYHDALPERTYRARAVAKAYGVPDTVIGLPTSRWQRIVQRFTRRATQRSHRR